MLELFLIRGLSGAGKSTLVDALHIDSDSWDKTGSYSFAVSADDFFVGDDGVYRFDPSKLSEAHGRSQLMAEGHFHAAFRKDPNVGRDDPSNPWNDKPEHGVRVIVHNTFSSRWEMEPYIKMAKKYGAKLVVIDLFDGGQTDEELFRRNLHNVPLEVIQQMRRRWEFNWKDGNPIPPWERKFNRSKP